MILKNNLKRICALLLVLVLVTGQFCASIIAFAEAGAPAVVIENNSSRLVAKTENIASPTYKWQRAAAINGEYKDIDGATSKYYDVTLADKGHYVRVIASGITSEPTSEPIGELIVFDISKGSVTFDSQYIGKDFDGEEIKGTHTETNIYVIQQSGEKTYATEYTDAKMKPYTENKVSFKGEHLDTTFDVTLDGVHLGSTPVSGKLPGSSGIGSYDKGVVDIQPDGGIGSKSVILRLKGENIVRAIHYSAKEVKGADTSKSSFKITDVNGDGEYEGGTLYAPVKVDTDKINDFVASKLSWNHWNSAIGGDDGSHDRVDNFEIAGGDLQILTTYADNCTAIGAGGNAYGKILISGGKVVAHCNGTGAAIGGGIGWNNAGGSSDVIITGGNVYAKNHGKIFIMAQRDGDGKVTSSTIVTEEDDYTDVVGGVAIGAGSSFFSSGSKGTVQVNGGIVTAIAVHGNGMGGGNSSTSTGGDAEITISGGTVSSTAIGGGNSQKGVGGDATVVVNAPSDVTIEGGIGGGDSLSGTGGEATITVNGGTMNCGGIIGGGNGALVGNGGKAKVTVKGGKLTSSAIGGGTGGASGNGGAAEIYIEDGIIETGSIGGGATVNESGQLGYAKAVISGGDIKGQFLMAEGGTAPCTFEMSGGTLHGVNALDTTKYTKNYGGAVYMDDSDGTVTITGGTIEKCNAQRGGAIYMTAGTFIIGNDEEETAESPKATIKNCTSEESGGAVYLGGGKMIIKNNAVVSNNTAKTSGGAAYVGGGDVEVSGGEISNNNAIVNGGGIAVADGNYLMYGGKVLSNNAQTGNGGGIYVSSETVAVDVKIRSGVVSSNTAYLSGGAVAVVGKEAADAKVITTTIGVKDVHKKQVGDQLVSVPCEHSPYDDGTDLIQVNDCPVFEGNSGQKSGGAIYIAGNDQAQLNIYCLVEHDSTSGGDKNQSDFLKVEGGKVVISTDADDDTATQDSLYGNIDIDSTIYATNGKFDIYGSMENPLIKNIMTVDIKDTENDYFKDWRITDGFYKLLYFENFTEPGAAGPTGQYKEVSVPIGSSVTIAGNIYEHPGYEIVGWNTDPEGLHYWEQGTHSTDGIIDDTGFYGVGKTYTFDGEPIGDLVIYAIWKANGYKVNYLPNCTDYTGTMEEASFYYDKWTNLDENQFGREGYKFIGWAINPEPEEGEKIYADKELVKNLTTIKGDKVYLYAQWEKCDHNYNNTYTYEVIDGGILKRTCSCKGYAETAAILASDSVYHRDRTNPADVVVTQSWSAGLEKISPAGTLWEPVLKYTKDGAAFTGTPKNAGTYVASITETDKSGQKHTASLTYTIEKAEQEAPEKPIYTDGIVGNQNVLKVSHVAPSQIGVESSSVYDASYDGVAQYKLEYRKGDETIVVGWLEADDIADEFARIFQLEYTYTKYSIYARYGESENYKPSAEVKADRDYVYADGVTLSITCEEGMDYDVLTEEGSVTGEGNGIQLKIWNKDGYYIPSGHKATLVTKELSDPDTLKDESDWAVLKKGSAVMSGTTENVEYSIIQITADSLLELNIPAAKKVPQVDSKITEKEVFGTVTTSAATISRDSAFTVFFNVKHYDDGEYSPLALDFSGELPVGTTIILLDKLSGTYYSHTVSSAVTDEIELTKFVKMGTIDTPFDFPAEGKEMQLQFVVDFSDVAEANLPAVDDLITSLTATKTGLDKEVFNIDKGIKSVLKDISTFGMTIVKEQLITKVTTVVNESEGVSSKWDNSYTALILEPKQQIPSDAYILCTGTKTTSVYRNAEGKFIIPIGELDDGMLSLKLVSTQFSAVAKTYSFDATWMISKSKAASAPMNGKVLADCVVVTLEGVKAIPISLKVTADKRIYDREELASQQKTMNATVVWKDLPLNYDLEVTLMYKNDNGNFVNTGWSQIIDYNASYDRAELSIPLENQNPGSYYLRVEVNEGLEKVAEVYYYFILK